MLTDRAFFPKTSAGGFRLGLNDFGKYSICDYFSLNTIKIYKSYIPAAPSDFSCVNVNKNVRINETVTVPVFNVLLTTFDCFVVSELETSPD